MKSARSVLTAVFLALSAAFPAWADDSPDLQSRLDPSAPQVTVAGRTMDSAPLRAFYAARGYRLAWSGAANETNGDRLIADLQTAAFAAGLAPEPYAIPPTASDTERDLLVSDAVLRLAHDLALGRMAPLQSFGGLLTPPVGRATLPFDPARLLADAASSRPFSEIAAAVTPQSADYRGLEKALTRYRDIARAGGWPFIPDGPTLRPGQADPRVPLLRIRLKTSGDLPDSAAARGDVLDPALTSALEHFQMRHGLTPDGTVGRGTLAALDVPADTRVDQLRANLERERWAPRTMEPRYVEVNIPAQTFELVENGAVTLRMRVVVGDIKHPTPGMTTSMTAVIVNPSWTVPASIATKEILPKLRRDPGYLMANNMRILDAFPEDSPQSAGVGMDWSRVGGKFPYRLRQRPGPENALGRLKFYLTQSDDIYMHDTPQKSFFKRDYRALSHGCVRLEKPKDLAEHILGPEEMKTVDEELAGRTTHTLHLRAAIPVHLLYRTAWVDPDGTVNFREDIYGHDARLAAALSHAVSRGFAAQAQTGAPL